MCLPEVQGVGLLSQLRPEVRMGYGDQVFHPLAHGAAVDGGDAVLSDDVVHSVPAQGDHAARSVLGHDGGDGVILFGGLDADDGIESDYVISGGVYLGKPF